MTASEHEPGSANYWEECWCEQVVVLRDALVSYLGPANVLLEMGHPDGNGEHIDRCRALLRELDAIEVNPLLHPLTEKGR
jgi:hypothetical protein